MKPHSHAAPGLGQLDNQLAKLAAQYRKRINRELRTTRPQKTPEETP